MKKLLFLFCVILWNTSGFAQAQDGYTLGATVDGVACYYKLSQCDGRTVVLLQFDNTNPASVAVSWTDVFAVTASTENITGFKTRLYTLLPGMTSAPVCGDPQTKLYVLGPEDVVRTHKTEITRFEFKDVMVTANN